MHYAIERFLFRMGKSSYKDQFILKGAFALNMIYQYYPRATRDIDFLCMSPSLKRQMMHIFQRICAISYPDDGMRYDPDSISLLDIKVNHIYPGTIIKLNSYLGNARNIMQIDVGFSDAIFPEKIRLTNKGILEDIEAPDLFSYSVETIIAEKLHTVFIRSDFNSRLKDFYDLWFLVQQKEPSLSLKEAITRTFAHRQTALPNPQDLFPKQYATPEREIQWQTITNKIPSQPNPPELQTVLGELHTYFVKLLT